MHRSSAWSGLDALRPRPRTTPRVWELQTSTSEHIHVGYQKPLNFGVFASGEVAGNISIGLAGQANQWLFSPIDTCADLFSPMVAGCPGVPFAPGGTLTHVD